MNALNVNGRALTSGWRDYLLKICSQKCNCVIAFGYSHVSQRSSQKKRYPFIRQDARCTFDNCCKFRFEVKKNQDFEESIEILMITFGRENHGQQHRKFRRTNAIEKKEMVTLLDSTTPDEAFEILLDNADPTKLAAGNYNVPKSPAVLRRIKTLVSACERYHNDVNIDLHVIQTLYKESDVDQKIKGFIQARGNSPFFVTMYTEEQILLLTGKSCPILYFNATGSIFKKWQGFSKRMLLYSLVTPNSHVNEPAIAIAEMISDTHTTEMISHFLFSFRMDVNRVRSRGLQPFPAQLVITDFSWAIIHAVFHSFSLHMNINNYLLVTYNALANKKKWENCTGVFLCANHVIHIVARKFKSMEKNLVKTFIQEFSLLQYTTDFQDSIAIARLILTVHGTEHLSNDNRQAAMELLDRVKKWSSTNSCQRLAEHPGLMHDENGNEDYHDIVTNIRRSSPWMEYFTILHKEQCKNDDSSDELNPYFSTELVDYLLNFWLPLFPLWCMSISQLFDVTGTKSWYTNAHVEGWFSCVKERHLKRSGTGARVRVSKFIQNQRTLILRRLKRFQLSESRDCSTKKAKLNASESLHEAQEEWGKKSRGRKRARYVKPSQTATDKMFSDILIHGVITKNDIDAPAVQEFRNKKLLEDKLDTCASENVESSHKQSYVEIHKKFKLSRKTKNIRRDVTNDTSHSHDLPDLDSDGLEHQLKSLTKDIKLPMKANKEMSLKKSPCKQSKLSNDKCTKAKGKSKTSNDEHESGMFKLEFMIKTGLCLTLFDRNSLIGDSWLSINIIHGFLACVQTPEFAMCTDNDWINIVKGNQPFSATETDWTLKKFIYINRAEHGHFFSILINLTEKTITCLDSLGRGYERARHCCSVWNKFVRTCLVNIIKGTLTFNTTNIPVPQQKDGSSCGVLVCMYALQLCMNKSLNDIKTDKDSITQYRAQIWETLMNNRDRERCCACRKHDDRQNVEGSLHYWLTCSSCGNRFHSDCVKEDLASISNKDETQTHLKTSTIWECSYCKCT